MAGGAEHQFSAVPLNERRGTFTMSLLWITMVTSFPSVLVGFQWYKDGFSLGQVLSCTLLSCLLLLAYTLPASQLGARTGQSYTVLSRSVFGRLGAQIVSFNLVWIFVAWYGLAALFLAEGLAGLVKLPLPLMWMSALFAILMACNNFFGFKGVANFARYVAAPVLIIWVGYTFIKTLGVCPSTVLHEPAVKSFASALTSISGFVIGFAVWGNEADYWRFGKPKTSASAVPLVIALAIGQFIFPATGWMVARSTGITEYAAATAFMNEYSFGGYAILGALVLFASYFAVNDSNLFGSVQACAQLKNLPPRLWVTILATVGTLMAAWLSVSGAAKSLESMASLNCVFLPTATVIMLCEWFLWQRVFKKSARFCARVPESHELPTLRWPAICALVAGLFVGVVTAGVIPGLESLHVGICSVQAWLASIIVYVPMRLLEERAANMDRLLVASREPVKVYVSNSD